MKEKKILINYLLYIFFFIGVCIIGVTNIFALETKTIYSVNNNGTLSSANTYNYGYMTGGGTQSIARATVGNTVSGVAYGFNFSFYENIVLNKTYTMVINFKDSDLLKSFSSDMVQVSACNNNTCNENILVSVIKNNNSGNSNKLTIQFNPITTGAIILVNLGSDQAITGISTFGISSVTLDNTNQNEDIMNNANQNANNIINNNNSNTQDIINNQNSNASVIQDTINDNFNTTVNCPNLFDISKVITNSTLLINNGSSLTINAPSGNTAAAGSTPNKLSDYCPSCIVGETYSLNAITTGTNKYIYLSTARSSWSFGTSRTLTQDDLNSIVYWYASGVNTSATISNIQIEKGNTSTSYCIYGSSSSVNKLDEGEKTRKGILGKLGDLISYINPSSDNFFLKLAFIPSSTFLENWYADFRNWIELKLGFLSTPITLFLDFINLYLNLNEEDIIINIPEITVPNFEEVTLIQAQTFNWSDLLESKQEFNTLWNLYLDFIDVFLILNFLGLCEVTYNRIFGGDTSQYEYYTTEETYSINDETGEATNHQLRQRRTRREKV